ncbi:hypothetical protein O0I10_010599 [Lichtheimia ornata]|uniref:DUF1206 domain-containing protein n=1 Tax=Lichtheimia ornata TaxID=688661 RepID=A0AAD7UV36_9FUNG|nr:uncharacterized protein O0I10_010599 [Lichtheimia ornata]KAJ8653800.1 hypothetical protein O0I10_010599 [Lichtheimia ornata]
MTAVSLKKSNRDSTASWSPLTTAAGARGDDDATSQKSSTSAANDNNEPHETMTDTPSRDYTTIPIQVSTDDTATTDNNDTTAATATATTPTSLSPEPANSDNASSQPDRKNDAKVPNIIRVKSLPFYRGGVRPRHAKIVRFIGRCGFVAKGVVYGIIGVLILTNVSGAWTPNGSQGNESPQGAFLLLGGIPAIGRPILVVMAIGLITYLVWRFWEAITGQAFDAMLSKRTNFFRYRLSPIVSGGVYCAYLYYLIQMIYQTNEEQQKTASSNEFPASFTDTTVGSAFVGVFGVAFMIAFATQIQNAVTGNFIPDLKTSAPDARKWEARIVNLSGRIGFGGRAAMFGTLSGFFWDSLAKRNESGNVNVVAAAISKLATHDGGKAFMVLLGLGLIIYGLFAIANAYYKYFPTPPPSRINMYQLITEEDDNDMNSQEQDEPNNEPNHGTSWWRRLWDKRHPKRSQQQCNNEKGGGEENHVEATTTTIPNGRPHHHDSQDGASTNTNDAIV